MIFNLAVLLLVLASFALQEFVPSIPIAYHARLFLPAVCFFAAAVATPFPIMLMLAFVTGFLWDARYLPAPAIKDDASAALVEAAAQDPMALMSGEIAFGVSIFLFGLLGSLMQGVRPLFKRGRLELPVLMTGIAMFGWLLLQFLMITFVRGRFSFPNEVWSKMVTDTLLAMLVAPVIFLILHGLARWTRYEIRYDGLRYNFIHGR